MFLYQIEIEVEVYLPVLIDFLNNSIVYFRYSGLYIILVSHVKHGWVFVYTTE